MNFSVKSGEIFGFLGPSGAGRDHCPEDYDWIDNELSGKRRVNGTGAGNRTQAFYEDIGVDFEFPALYEKLTARQNLEYFASLYGRVCKAAAGKPGKSGTGKGW